MLSEKWEKLDNRTWIYDYEDNGFLIRVFAVDLFNKIVIKNIIVTHAISGFSGIVGMNIPVSNNVIVSDNHAAAAAIADYLEMTEYTVIINEEKIKNRVKFLRDSWQF